MEIREKERYESNRILMEEEQKILMSKGVAVIGCGGLGGYVAEFLGRLGIGRLLVCDGDVFCPSNLNRQLHCTEKNIGEFKAEAVKKRLGKVNSNVEVQAENIFLNEENGKRILEGIDIVIDALDHVKDRLLLQDICNDLKIPMVHGAVEGWYGQVTVVLPGDNTLSCLYQSGQETAQEQGSPAFTPALAASVEVAETVKLLLHKGNVLRKKVLMIDLLNEEYEVIEIK